MDQLVAWVKQEPIASLVHPLLVPSPENVLIEIARLKTAQSRGCGALPEEFVALVARQRILGVQFVVLLYEDCLEYRLLVSVEEELPLVQLFVFAIDTACLHLSQERVFCVHLLGGIRDRIPTITFLDLEMLLPIFRHRFSSASKFSLPRVYTK